MVQIAWRHLWGVGMCRIIVNVNNLLACCVFYEGVYIALKIGFMRFTHCL